jgi:hypothetical protein
MTLKQQKWRDTLPSPVAKAKTKRNAIAGLLASGIPQNVIAVWAKIGAGQTPVQ